jgi:hypothetical protein
VSPVLKTYWRQLGFALQESERVIVVGYAGLDEHLNDQIRAHAAGKRILVVEWSGAGKLDKRTEFWKGALSKDVIVKPMENILEFSEWQVDSLNSKHRPLRNLKRNSSFCFRDDKEKGREAHIIASRSAPRYCA